MKRRFSGSGDDSLELLLDTLCNVFGGIVLIACLLAIIPRAALPPPLLPTAEASTQMTERRIVSARAELQRLEREIKGLPQSVDPERTALQNRRDSLARTVDARRTTRKEIEGKETSEANARSIVASSDPDALNEALERIKRQVVGEENLANASEEKIRFLEERMKLLSEEAETLGKGKVQAVRFPRERMKDGSPFPIIAQYAQLYPLLIGNQLEANKAIHREPSADRDGFRADPIPGNGIALPDSRPLLMATLKSAASKGHYVSIYLYPDSHEVFQELRNALADEKIPYGLEFEESEHRLSFSSSGSAPPEL